MLRILSFSVMLMMSLTSLGEVRAWNFKNGKSMEAEFVAVSGGQVSLKSVKGKVKKIPYAEFMDEDLRYIELQNPPQLDLDLGKSVRTHAYLGNFNGGGDIPSKDIYTLTAKVKQTSSKVYNHPLTLEFFTIGEENIGDKNILYSYHKETFNLPEGSGSTFTISTDEIDVIEYVSNGQLSGEAYKGYMMIVKDFRGEIIASKASRDDWFAIAETLAKLPVGRTFDPATGERCFPTRPKRWY